MGLTECALINRSKQSRKANPSARREQLVWIRKAEPGLIGDVFSASRCIVTNSNRTPGYRSSRQAGRMDCHQKVQNGHRVLYGDRCGRSGHSLMSLMLCVFLAIVSILSVNGNPESCDNMTVLDDEWRDLSAPQGGKTDYCDKDQFVPGKWYTFILRGEAAWVPTVCIKSNMCGANVGMRVDLIGQSLPSVGENITAALCGAYDVLGKYDCCVLRTTVHIIRCQGDRLGYSFPTPFDRCAVAVCTQGKNVQVPPRAIVKMGEDVNKPEDSTVTDIPETTPDASDSTTTETTTAEVIVEDTTSEEPTESPAPPQPFMQQTTSETSTPDVDEQQSTTAVTAETTPSFSSTEASSQADVDNEGTDSTTTGVPDTVTESVTDSETSSTLVYEINTLTTTSEDRQESSELTTAETSPEQASTESTESLVSGQSQETKSDTIQEVSSDVNFLSSTDLSTSEQPMTLETETTVRDISDEELSSTTRSIQETDDKKSNDSADEAATRTRDDLSDTTPSVSVSSEAHEPTSTAAEQEESSSISTSTVADTTNTETTSTTTESLLETTREPTERTHLISSSSTTTEAKDVTTSKKVAPGEDVTIDEILRFVFQGEPPNNAPVVKVQELLEEFLRRAKDKEDWTYELFSVSKAVNYENTSTYMDFRIVRRGNDLKDGDTFFEKHQLKKFVYENTNMTLLAQCRASKNCQENVYSFITPLASVFEQNAPAFTAIIVVCAICLLIVILVVLYTRFSKRGSWRAPEPQEEPNKSPRNSRQINGTQSPFTDAQIMKDEMVDNASASFNGSAKDGDTNLSGTWVIPLDQEPGNQNTVVSITTEDTKF